VAAAVFALGFALAGDAAVLADAGSTSSTLRVPQDFSTIQAAIDAAAPGDTVSVAPGLYSGGITNNGKAITIESTGGAAVTTISGSSQGSVVNLAAEAGETPVLRGFTITDGHDGGVTTNGGPALIENNTITGNTASAGAGAGIRASASAATIRGNTITDNGAHCCSGGTGGGGILLISGGTATVRNNVISGNSTSGNGGGISMFSAGTPVIDGNTISGNSDSGCDAGAMWLANASNAVIENNVIVNNNAGCSSGVAVDWTVPSGNQGPTFVNNTVVGTGTALRTNYFTANAKVVNNILVASGTAPVVSCVNSQAPQLSFNNVLNRGSGTRYDGCADPTGTSGNISVDPEFVDPSGDYHLACGSPAMDVGTATGAPPLDHDGMARPLDGNADGVFAVDMGAYEGRVACTPAGSQPPGAPTLIAPGTATAGSSSFVYAVGAAGATMTFFDQGVPTAIAVADASGFAAASMSLAGDNGRVVTATQTVGGLTSPAWPPASIRGISGVGTATVTFTPPAESVDFYRVIALPGGATATGASSPIAVAGLTNGVAYSFRVVGVNAGGFGPASTSSNAVKPGLPVEPGNVVAAPGDKTVELSWTTPFSDGGSPITGYVVTPYLGGIAQTPIPLGVVNSTTVAGLTNRAIYTFMIAAVNGFGTGLAVESSAVIPAAPRAAVPEPPAFEPRQAHPDVSVAGTVRPPLPGP
jgi:parallel beta-helix repeat protein